jgi:hypothetical protein
MNDHYELWFFFAVYVVMAGLFYGICKAFPPKPVTTGWSRFSIGLRSALVCWFVLIGVYFALAFADAFLYDSQHGWFKVIVSRDAASDTH